MNSKIMYTNNGNLEKQIKTKKIIPYMVYPNEGYKKGKWYYSLFFNTIFKVLEANYSNGELESAYTVSDDGNKSVICTDLDFQEDYSISRDRRGIYKMDIINYPESFTGAEIVYWFFINNITSFDKKYENFWKYVDRYSLDRVLDRERYFLKAKFIGNKYVDCEVIKDISKAHYDKNIVDKIHRPDNNNYMADLKHKDLNRMKDKHKNDYL